MQEKQYVKKDVLLGFMDGLNYAYPRNEYEKGWSDVIKIIKEFVKEK